MFFFTCFLHLILNVTINQIVHAEKTNTLEEGKEWKDKLAAI